MEKKRLNEAFKQHYPALLLYAKKYLGDELSKDAVQSVFLKLLEKNDLLKIKNFKSYLFTSVRNYCIDYLKSPILNKVINLNEEIEIEGNNIDLIEQAEFEAQLFGFIEKLSPSTKRIFKMSRFDLLTNSEIAEELSLSKRTVELQISNALKALREMIQNSDLMESVGRRMMLLLF